MILGESALWISLIKKPVVQNISMKDRMEFGRCLLSHMQLDFMASVYTCEGSKSVEREDAYCLLAYFEAIN